VVRVDVIDVEVRRLRCRLARCRHGVQGDFGLARKGGEDSATIADQMIFACDDAGERRADRDAVDLRQDGVEGRALAIARDKNGNVFLIEAGMFRRSSTFARLAGQIGPAALEGFEKEGLVGLDDAGQRSRLVSRRRSEKPVTPAKSGRRMNAAEICGEKVLT
jgi:hypothetical protein